LTLVESTVREVVLDSSREYCTRSCRE